MGRTIKISFYILIIMFMSAFIFMRYNIFINKTPSVDIGLYQDAGEKTVIKGDLARFDLPDEARALFADRAYGQTQSLLKRVQGLPGDQIKITERGISVNGVVLKNSVCLEKDSKGKLMLQAVLPREIPPGRALVMGDASMSFDSRYFGLVDLSSLVKVKPLLTYSAARY